MKRELSAVLSCFFLFGFQSQPKWEKVTVIETEKYGTLYHLDRGPNACKVYVKTGKGGLRLEAFVIGRMPATNGIESLMTAVDIGQTTVGVSVKMANFKQVVGGHQKWQPNTENHEDLFATLCGEDARSLPRGIQRMFLGNYGLGKPASKR